MTRSRVVRIGSSWGVRIPKTLLEQAGLEDEVELHVEDGRLVVAAVRQLRSGWAAAAQRMQSRGEGEMLDAPSSMQFDAEEWEWR